MHYYSCWTTEMMTWTGSADGWVWACRLTFLPVNRVDWWVPYHITINSSWIHWQHLPGLTGFRKHRVMLQVNPGSIHADMLGYWSVKCIWGWPSWKAVTEPNSAVHGFPRKPEHFLSSKSSWTPETQANGALRRHLVEFLVLNSAFGKWL